MLDDCDYTRDGKFISLRKTWSKEGDAEVPVTLLDELMERGLSLYDLEKLLTFRRLTKDRNFRRASIEELVGTDLTGKTVVIYFANWGDSEILSSPNAVTVVEESGEFGGSSTYSFEFPEEWRKCHEGECNHEQTDEECPYDSLEGYNFHKGETVFIMDKEKESVG